MTTTIIFSRNRAAQLDLLLRSRPLHHPVVLYRADTDEYQKGYETCQRTHRAVFIRETDFQNQFEMLLAGADRYVMLLCDDDVFYRRNIQQLPEAVLEANHDLIAFSTRLGENTVYCYPLNKHQNPPIAQLKVFYKTWDWRVAEHDFAYPGSIDGTVFRTNQLMMMLQKDYENPNQLEETIMTGCRSYGLPKLASYVESILVGMPINRVNDSHPNRCENFISAEELNEKYLNGERISLSTIELEKVNAAHTPFKLKWLTKN